MENFYSNVSLSLSLLLYSVRRKNNRVVYVIRERNIHSMRERKTSALLKEREREKAQEAVEKEEEEERVKDEKDNFSLIMERNRLAVVSKRRTKKKLFRYEN